MAIKENTRHFLDDLVKAVGQAWHMSLNAADNEVTSVEKFSIVATVSCMLGQGVKRIHQRKLPVYTSTSSWNSVARRCSRPVHISLMLWRPGMEVHYCLFSLASPTVRKGRGADHE